MLNHEIELSRAKDMLDNFRAEFPNSQYSSYISRDQLQQILDDPSIIGLNVYHGFFDNNFHLIVVGATEPSSNEYQIQDDLNCIKNVWQGGPGLNIEPNDLNS